MYSGRRPVRVQAGNVPTVVSTVNHVIFCSLFEHCTKNPGGHVINAEASSATSAHNQPCYANKGSAAQTVESVQRSMNMVKRSQQVTERWSAKMVGSDIVDALRQWREQHHVAQRKDTREMHGSAEFWRRSLNGRKNKKNARCASVG